LARSLAKRQGHQLLLAIALEDRLADHSVQFRDKIRVRASGVSLDDLSSKGFALITVAVTCFDLEHVDKHVKALFTIMGFPASFEKRFFGNLTNFNAELAAELDRFEEVNGVINRQLLQQLLLMDVMLTSKTKSMSLWRKQVRDQEKIIDALQSRKK
jgi:hypothetical protein